MCLGLEEDCLQMCPTHIVTHTLENVFFLPTPEQGVTDVEPEIAEEGEPCPGEELLSATGFPQYMQVSIA